MKLEQVQIDKITALVGDEETTKKVLDYLTSVKGRVKIFDDDGEVTLTKEELLKKTINKPAKKVPVKKIAPVVKPKELSYVELAEQVNKLTEQLKAKRTERLAEIDKAIDSLQKEKAEIEASIAREQEQQ